MRLPRRPAHRGGLVERRDARDADARGLPERFHGTGQVLLAVSQIAAQGDVRGDAHGSDFSLLGCFACPDVFVENGGPATGGVGGISLLSFSAAVDMG